MSRSHIFLLFATLAIKGCAAHRSELRSIRQVEKESALTSLDKIEQLKAFSSSDEKNLFCFVERKNEIYFINGQRYRSGLDFLRSNIAEYRALSESDFYTLFDHPYLREVYCGGIYSQKKASKEIFYVTLNNESQLEIDRIESIVKTIEGRLQIANSKVYFTYVDPGLYRVKRRAFIARGIPLRKLNLTRDMPSSKSATDVQNTFLSTNTQELDLANSNDELSENSYGILAAKSDTASERSMYIPFVAYEYLLREEIDSLTCSRSKNTCQQSFGNYCQVAHGQCLTLTMQRTRPTFLDLLTSFDKMPIFTEPTSKNKLIRQGTLAFAGGVIAQLTFDSRLLFSYAAGLKEAFPDASSLVLAVSSNATKQRNDPTLFTERTYYCLPERQDANCSTVSGELKLSRALLKAYASAFNLTNFSSMNKRDNMTALRLGIRFREVTPNHRAVGYVYVHPDAGSQSLNIKLVNISSENKQVQNSDEIYYFSVNSENKIVSFESKGTALSPENDNEVTLPEQLRERLIIDVKKEYINQLSINNKSDKRLYTFKYFVSSLGSTRLSRY